MAVVADASALALDALTDAAFAGRLADVEKEFAKAAVAGTNAEHDRVRRVAPGRAAACVAATVEEGAIGRRRRSIRCSRRIHFRRKPLVEAALKAWTAERLARVMAMLAEASLDARMQSDLAETIARRALSIDRKRRGADGKLA